MREYAIEIAQIPIKLKLDKEIMINNRLSRVFDKFRYSGRRKTKAILEIKLIKDLKSRQISRIREDQLPRFYISKYFKKIFNPSNLVKNKYGEHRYYITVNSRRIIILHLGFSRGIIYFFNDKENGPLGLSEDILSSLLQIYNQLILKSNGIFLHCCGIIKEKKGFIFLGGSGSGKTTIASFSKEFTILSDEIVAVRKLGNSFFAFASPWGNYAVDNERSSNMKEKINYIFLLKKDRRVFFENVSPTGAMLFTLLNQGYLAGNFLFLEELFRNLPTKIMYFCKNNSFWLAINHLVESEVGK